MIGWIDWLDRLESYKSFPIPLGCDAYTAACVDDLVQLLDMTSACAIHIARCTVGISRICGVVVIYFFINIIVGPELFYGFKATF